MKLKELKNISYKKVNYLLKLVHISFDLAKVLKWRQLYRLLKKASRLNDKFKMPRKDLKLMAKQIVANDEVVEVATKLFEIDFLKFEDEKEKFQFIPFVKPFFDLFLDKFPLLLI